MQFKSPEHLLAWTFETLATPIVKTSRADLREESGGCGAPPDKLSHYDRHAQAAFVLRWISTLPVAQKSVLFGLYDPALRQSACISLATEVEHRFGMHAAAYAVRMWITPLRQAGKPVGTERGLANVAGTSPATARRYKTAVWDELDKLRLQALAAVGRQFGELIGELEPVDEEEMVVA